MERLDIASCQSVREPSGTPHRPEGVLSEFRGEVMLADLQWKAVFNTR